MSPRPIFPSCSAMYVTWTNFPIMQSNVCHLDQFSHHAMQCMSPGQIFPSCCAMYVTSTNFPIMQCNVCHLDQFSHHAVPCMSPGPIFPSCNAMYVTWTNFPIMQRAMYVTSTNFPIMQCNVCQLDYFSHHAVQYLSPRLVPCLLSTQLNWKHVQMKKKKM